MGTEKHKKRNNVSIQSIIGIVLISPSIVSVFLFFIGLLIDSRDVDNYVNRIINMTNLNYHWFGKIYIAEGGGGFTSALPFYFGLMAIAGALLLKNNKH